jgi:hypothetical protein
MYILDWPGSQKGYSGQYDAAGILFVVITFTIPCNTGQATIVFCPEEPPMKRMCASFWLCS